MSILADLSLVILGIALLYGGGEVLVRGAVGLARSFGISTWVIGMTVVSAATSMPELATTLVAFLKNTPAVGVGNIVGSNIANIGLILGMTTLVQPLHPHARAFSHEIPFMILISIVMTMFSLSGYSLTRPEAFLLFIGGVTYLGWMVHTQESQDMIDEFEKEFSLLPPRTHSFALVGLGIILLAGGSKTLVEGSVSLARMLGVSERVIGLTLVALGTSLPELASSLVAAAKKEADIALGNVVGSNIFNIAIVLGISVFVHPVPLEPTMTRDLIVMLGFSLVLYLSARSHSISRFYGSLFLAGYWIYILSLRF